MEQTSPVASLGAQTAALYSLVFSTFTLSVRYKYWEESWIFLWSIIMLLILAVYWINAPLYAWALYSKQKNWALRFLKIHPLIFGVILWYGIHWSFFGVSAIGFAFFTQLFWKKYQDGTMIPCTKISIVRCFFSQCPSLYTIFFVLGLVIAWVVLWCFVMKP